MKLNEDFGLDRGDEFQTDDEENEAERICWHEDDTESEDTVSSGSPSDKNMYLSNSSWPQSYRYVRYLHFPSYSSI
jgi:vesicular inhibitory amino acid transporter